MYSDDHRDPSAVCVEFTFRVHSDGRRERLAVVLVRGRDGIWRPGPRQPTGDLARFVAKAIGEAMDELSPDGEPTAATRSGGPSPKGLAQILHQHRQVQRVARRADESKMLVERRSPLVAGVDQ